ncbi:probable 4-coumarate--CoA ligase 3 [Pomacea canaliculata]|uniref:probable 4-coumarate--CoA ligase 3 n=1 Tax=Pomacea canaliculata TaxID=400727 RepID=UPI000D7274B9|nr:probable 4-coumarate--CoA ligase 3 [Pomacea canaliculata]
MFGLSADDTVTSRLRYWSVTSPETLAFVYVTPDGQRFAYTRQELFSMSRRAASWLSKRNVCRSDIVLCLVPTSPEQTFIALGTALLGATVMCTNMQYRDGSDISPLMKTGDVTAVVVDETDQQAIAALQTFIPNLSAPSVVSEAVPSLKSVIFCNRFSQLSFLVAVAAEEEGDLADVSPDDVTTIFATSGSSGQPKLVPRTHREAMTMGLGHYQCSHQSESSLKTDVIYNPSSFGWATGYPSVYLTTGQTRVVPYVIGAPPDDEAKFTMDLMKSEGVVSAFLLPQTMKTLLARADLLHCDVTWRLDLIVTGGNSVRTDIARVIGTLTARLVVVYGSTEVGIATYKTYDDPLKVVNFNCGRPVDGMAVKNCRRQSEEVPPTKGEIMIKHNGISPGTSSTQLLESHLMKCPGVHDVAVVAIPDKDFENLPCVCVVQDPRPEAPLVLPEDLLRACAEYFQDSFRQVNKQRDVAVPPVCLVFDKFPLNPNGKVQRGALRALAVERLGL